MKKSVFFAIVVVFSFQLTAQTNFRNDTTSIPFIEDWSSGDFETNNWETNSSNWMINQGEGNEAPCAEFQSQTQLIDYSETLTSTFIDADSITEGIIYLDFDLKLEDIDAGETEILLLKIYDGLEWTILRQKNKGSFDWTHYHLGISPLANHNVFQIQFEALGQNSGNIQNWMIDNISIYKICDPPKKLQGDLYSLTTGEEGALIQWEAPLTQAPGPNYYIYWDNSENSSGFGLENGGTFTVAAYWPENSFESYFYKITEVNVFAYDAGFTNWTVKIWSGESASNLLYSQDITDQINIGSWTTIVLTEPVPLDITDELWIGYSIDGLAGFSPAGVDDGPAYVGNGDKILLEGGSWENMSDYGLDFNWNIHAFIVSPSNSKSVKLLNSPGNNQKAQSITGNRNLSHFNIYRLSEGEQDYSLLAEVPFVVWQTDYEYFDEVNVNITNCYKVTAVWESNIDSCESEPAKNKFAPIYDYACVLISNENNTSLNNKLTIFPNPATSQLTIQSEVGIEEITLLNAFGQVILTKQINDKQAVLNTSALNSGIYFVKLKTGKGVFNKKIVINQ